MLPVWHNISWFITLADSHPPCDMCLAVTLNALDSWDIHKTIVTSILERVHECMKHSWFLCSNSTLQQICREFYLNFFLKIQYILMYDRMTKMIKKTWQKKIPSGFSHCIYPYGSHLCHAEHLWRAQSWPLMTGNVNICIKARGIWKDTCLTLHSVMCLLMV